MPSSSQAAASPSLLWERVMSETRYGRYADRIESQVIAYALSRCPVPGVLLDVGCEGGRKSKSFADLGWQVIATDVEARSLQVCQSRIPNAHCALANPGARCLPADTASVDFALCIEVSPVIHSTWAVAEFARVLKPGAWFVGTCWNRHSWRGFLYHKIHALISSVSIRTYFNVAYSDFRREMTDHSFRFERELGYAWGPFRRTSNSPLVNPWAVLERISGLQSFARVAPMIAFVAQKT